MNTITRQFISETIHDFNRDIQINPGFTDIYCSRGMLKFSMDDISGAFNDWSTAIKLGCKKTIFLISYLTLA